MLKLTYMPRTTSKLTLFLLSFVHLFHCTVSQGCNTNSNPYCRGVAQFEALCCPYPNVCYWSNRNGQPACCPAGQSCLANAAGVTTTAAATQPVTPTSTVTVVVTSTIRGGTTTPATATTFVGVAASSVAQTLYQTVTSVTYLQQPTTEPSQPTIFTTVTTGAAVVGQSSASGVFVTVTQVQYVGGSAQSRHVSSTVVWMGLAGIVLAVWLAG